MFVTVLLHALTETSRRRCGCPAFVAFTLGPRCSCLSVQIQVVIGVAGVRDDSTDRPVAAVR